MWSGQLYQGMGDGMRESPSPFPVPLLYTPKLHYFHTFCLGPSRFGLHFLSEGKDGSHCCIFQAWKEHDLQLCRSLFSCSLVSLLLPFSLKGKHEAVLR